MKASTEGMAQFFWSFVKHRRKKFYLLLLMPIIWCVCETFAPYLIKILLDRILIPTEDALPSFLWIIGIVYISLMAVIELSIRFSNYLCIKIFPFTKEEMRKKVIDLIFSYPYSFFLTHESGNLLTNLKNLIDNCEQAFLSFLYGFYPTLATFFISLFLIGHISTMTALFFGCWFLGMNIITLFFLQASFHSSKHYGRIEGRLLGFVNDLFRNSLIIKTHPFNQRDSFLFEKLQNETIKAGLNAEWTAFTTDAYRGGISFFFLASMFAFILIQWKNGLLTLGDLAFITALCFYMRRSTWMATVQLVNFFKQLGIAKQSLSFLIQTPQSPTRPLLASETTITPDLTFKSIEFGYDQKKKIYTQFNLHIPENQKIGITGPSGVGKTTLVHLLLNLITPDSGHIYIGKHRLSDIDHSILKSVLTYIPQSAPLFHRSIYENIRYGNPHASRNDVIQAAMACQCTPFISQLAYGYNTIIGENGTKLSGGQRQCLSMARAYLKNSPILILDEATSAMDSQIESTVLKALLGLNRTTLVISHQPAVLKNLDRILIIHEGQIIADGPPEEVLTACA